MDEEQIDKDNEKKKLQKADVNDNIDEHSIDNDSDNFSDVEN